MNKPALNNKSAIALIICYCIMSYTAFVFYPKWNKERTEATISWDASGYYMYLPAMFVYQDLKKCAFKDSILKKYTPTPNFQQAFVHEKSGNWVMKYSIGQAVVMSPFFLVGHAWATFSSQYLADGFSFPYQFSIGFGMLLIAFLGLFVLRKILLNYYRDSTVSLLLLLYVIGTNYLNYSSIDQAMTHNSLFTIYALFVYATILFYKKQQTKYAIFIGLLIGLATLIRPTEILSIIIPLLWGVSNLNALKERWKFIITNFKKYLLAIPFFIAIVSIQLIYWKMVSGDWIVYSYQDQGFSWLHPHLFDYTFSYNCGWLRYTPMMILALLGLFFYYKKGANKFAVILYSILALYVTSAWDVWDYGGTAGRAMVQHYVILAFPLATLIEFVNKRKWSQFIFYPLIILFSYLNLWWVYNAHGGSIQVSNGTRAYYWKTVGRLESKLEYKKLLDNRYLFEGTPVAPQLVYENKLTIDTNEFILLNKEIQNSPVYKFKRNTPSLKWYRFSANFFCPDKEWNIWQQCEFKVKFYDSEKEVQSNSIRVYRFLNPWDNKVLYLDAKPPKKWTEIQIQFQNNGSEKEMKISDLKVITFDE